VTTALNRPLRPAAAAELRCLTIDHHKHSGSPPGESPSTDKRRGNRSRTLQTVLILYTIRSTEIFQCEVSEYPWCQVAQTKLPSCGPGLYGRRQDDDACR